MVLVASLTLPRERSASDTRGQEIRDAATVILLRRGGCETRVLMGQRGALAAFMPDKFVFPGGAVDAEDLVASQHVPGGDEPPARLLAHARPDAARALPLAAIRELWEETGLVLGRKHDRAVALAGSVPAAWRGFFEAGYLPDCTGLNFMFRAVTPPGRPRRFDARFFVADAAGVAGSLDDLCAPSDELRHLQWIEISKAREFPLPFITGVVLSEVEAMLNDPQAARKVPFFEHGADGSHFRLL
jgi:8-oxo-dGTP pyrophosphatase MutT (NUDIX family)